MFDLVVVLNDEVIDLFPDVEWHQQEDFWVAKVDHATAAEIARVTSRF
jgi:hypothetical protein